MDLIFGEHPKRIPNNISKVSFLIVGIVYNGCISCYALYTPYLFLISQSLSIDGNFASAKQIYENNCMNSMLQKSKVIKRLK